MSELTRYGFIWGPLTVQRTTELPNGRIVLTIQTRTKTLEVYVSETGCSMRVFHGAKELKE